MEIYVAETKALNSCSAPLYSHIFFKKQVSSGCGSFVLVIMVICYNLATCTCMQNKTQEYIFIFILFDIHLLKVFDMIQAVDFVHVHYRTIYLSPLETQFVNVISKA